MISQYYVNSVKHEIKCLRGKGGNNLKDYRVDYIVKVPT